MIRAQKAHALYMKGVYERRALKPSAHGIPYKYETRGQRQARRTKIEAEIEAEMNGDAAVPEGARREEIFSKLVDRRLRKPVDGFLLENRQERAKRVSKWRKGPKNWKGPGDSSKPPSHSTPAPTQIITISDTEGGHEGDHHQELEEYQTEESPSYVQGDGDEDYMDEDHDAGVEEGEEGADEDEAKEERELEALRWEDGAGPELWDGEGGEGEDGHEREWEEEGDETGEVVAEIGDIKGGTAAGRYNIMEQWRLVAIAMNEEIKKESPMSNPSDTNTGQSVPTPLQTLVSRWRAVRNPSYGVTAAC